MWNILNLVSPETKSILRRIGWGYVVCHVLVATLIVVSAIPEVTSGLWRQTQFLLELLFVIFIYPALIPAFVVCGGYMIIAQRCLGTGSRPRYYS